MSRRPESDGLPAAGHPTDGHRTDGDQIDLVEIDRDIEASDAPDLPAGSFSTWLDAMRRALAGDGESDVACGECTACCSSSQFVHIGPDETDALAHIPRQLLFAAPLMPTGHLLMGYDALGRCPMLGESGCSVYEHRPRTCRTYDCRVFPASGVELTDPTKSLIARQASRWTFDLDARDDRVRHDAVRHAADFVRHHADELPDGSAPTTETQLAVLAVELQQGFVAADLATGAIGPRTPDLDEVRVVLSRRPDR